MFAGHCIKLEIRDLLDFSVNSDIQFLKEAKREHLSFKITHKILRDAYFS